MAENVNLKTFNEDINALRGFVKSNGIEKDPYKIIVHLERFILEYGTIITRQTVSFLKSKEVTKEEKIMVTLDLIQTVKTKEELLIFKYHKYGTIEG